nr:ferredoxin--nitrite reductase, chloroplastic-like [Ipomoea batatas]
MASLSVKFLAPSLQIHPANKLPNTTRLHATPPQTVAASPPSEINAARLEPRVEERYGLLDAWVPADDIFPVCKAIMEAFRPGSGRLRAAD